MTLFRAGKTGCLELRFKFEFKSVSSCGLNLNSNGSEFEFKFSTFDGYVNVACGGVPGPFA